MKKVSELKRCLLSQAPELSHEIIEQLTKFVTGYRLNWFTDQDGNGVYFLLGDLAAVEGIHCRSILRSWKNFKARTQIKNAPVCPKTFTLEGKEVKELRLREPQLNIKPQANKLNVCNWSLIYAYKINADFPTVSLIEKVLYLPENVVQRQLAELSTFTSYPFQREAIVADITPSTIHHRRFDLVRHKGSDIEIYELKSRVLTNEDIACTLGTKRYLELAEYHYDCKVEFNFVAKGITNEASQLLRNINNVGFITIRDLAHRLKDEILKSVRSIEAKGTWFYERELEAFSILK